MAEIVHEGLRFRPGQKALQKSESLLDSLEPTEAPSEAEQSDLSEEPHEPSWKPIDCQAASCGDFAGGPARRISLSNAGWLPRFCVCLPGIMLFGGIGVICIAAAYSTSAFYAIAALLSIFTMSYSTDLAVSSLIGAWRMRRTSATDWDAELSALLEKQPELSDVMHIVILPNYKEDEQMMLRTLEQIAASTMAKSRIKVVLAMEAREGLDGSTKAERLVEKAKDWFADIFFTSHPADLPGDLAGKSSNTQWAYKQMLGRYSNDLSRRDSSHVLLSVGDADTLWHPQYFSALAFQALTTPAEERVWCFWQSPMLLFRNLMTAPAITRVSGYATLLFELAGLTNQTLTPALCFSSYSMTLALAHHPMVAGWDPDVIAEDHHMFCKCFFASIRWWQKVCPEGKKAPPRVQVKPIYLASTAFLVEEDGWMASVRARFQQATRHCQGVSELSYTVLQYITLIQEFGFRALPLSVHTGTASIIFKMAAVHQINQVEAFAVLLAAVLAAPGLLSWFLDGGLWNMLSIALAEGPLMAVEQQSFGGHARWTVYSICGPISPVLCLMVFTTFLVLRDLLQGDLTAKAVTKEDVQGYVGHRLSWWGWAKTYSLVAFDYFGSGQLTLFAFGLLPSMCASFRLLRHGTRLDYIVAAKPK
ncbi:unnamed protein product [Effrenium voratum]|uniref:Glycosyltransferase 2-like domain-containing protein n=1 Tax=Effrenium voratum TaxID=2562239 RepID=A0AA36MLJ9_9DINO|nr:unnamed protein product [Effrenium voratum]|mmetsp:Transcript_82149/g.196976  ORF Transcript_82149/g.196976 Transcript_82149/m.196976 type:complete len:647 (-) Transcript_82149:82-2022(-)